MSETDIPSDLSAELEALALAAAALPSVSAPSAVLGRVLQSTQHLHRFERYAATVAALLDVSLHEASAKLDRLDRPGAWQPGLFRGMELLHVTGGPAVANAVTGFVRIAAGKEFPEHEHLGQESVLVLQGRCVDGDKVFGPGDLAHMPTGSSHSFQVCAGPDLLYLAVVQTGVKVGGMVLTPDDPLA